MKKKIALILAAGLCLTSLASCGATEDDTVIIESTSSTKNISISADMVDTLGDYSQDFLNYLSESGFYDAEEVGVENDISLSLTRQQRESVVKELEEEADAVVASYKELGNRYAMNYSFDDEYLSVYCNSDDISSVQSLVTKMIGLMACAESITDNANAWTVSFTLSDATSGETLLAQEVSADNSIVWVYS